MFKRVKSKFSQLSRVSTLAPGFKRKTRFILWFLWLAVRHRIGIRDGRAGKLELVYKERGFDFYAAYSTDIAVLDEIFIRGIYEFDDNINPNTIFDIGSNTGVSVKFFNLKFNNASIFAFEPDPRIFRSLKLNTGVSGTVKAFNIAVAGHDGPMSFYAHPKSSIVSSLKPRFEEHEKIEVAGKSLNTITSELGLKDVDLVKFDAEGAEGEIFSSFDTTRIKMLVGEFHSDLARMSIDEFKTLFPAHELETVQISSFRYNVFGRKRE